MVRNELLVFFSTFIKRYENRFLVAAYEELVEEKRRLQDPVIVEADINRKSALQFGRPGSGDRDPVRSERVSKNTVHASIWKHVLILSVDPHAEVARNAMIIVDYIHAKLLDSPLAPHVKVVMDYLVYMGSTRTVQSRPPSPTPLPRLAEVDVSPTTSGPKKNASYISMGLKRTATAATALKNLAFGASDGQPTSGTSHDNADKPRPGGAVRARVPDEWSRPPDAHDPTLLTHTYQQAKIPLPRGYNMTECDCETCKSKKDKTRQGANKDEEKIPLKSVFFDWSVEVCISSSFVITMYLLIKLQVLPRTTNEDQ